MHFRVEDVGADLGVDIGSHQDKALPASDQKKWSTLNKLTYSPDINSNIVQHVL